MRTVTIDEKVHGVLVSLSHLIDFTSLHRVTLWRFHDVILAGSGRPFGMTISEFETATRAASGFDVSDEEFRAFLRSDIQIRDGEIQAWSERRPEGYVIQFDCQDATQWEITTNDPKLISKLKACLKERDSRYSQ